MKKLLLCAILGLVVMPMATYANDIVTTYNKTCGTCHDSGALNAPKRGDKATWGKLKAQKGMDKLVEATKRGMSQMPAKGLCQKCSDADFRALIEYMEKN